MSKILTKRELKSELIKTIDPTKTPKVQGGMRRNRGPMMGPKPKNIRHTVRRLIGYLGIYKVAIVFIALTLIVATLLNLLIPTLFSIALDDYFLTFEFTGVYRIVLMILGIAVINSLVRFISRFTMVRIAQKIVKQIRQEAFDKLLKAPISYYDEKGAGDLVSRVSNDIDLISQSLGQTVLEFINSTIILIGVTVLMFRLNWALSLVVLGFIPIILVFVVVISKKTRKGFREQQIHLASLNGIIEENISGIKVVKLYGQEPAFTEEFSDENEKLKKAGFMAQFYAGILWPFILFLNNLIYLVVIAVGAALFISVGAPFISIGQIAGVSQYSRQFIMPISNLGQQFNALMQGIAGAERVFELIDTPSEYEQDGEALIETFKGALAFEGVHFSYTPEVKVLQDINFDAKPGELIAIVGPTGGGKTTTIKVLNRFYDLDQGQIKIDGKDIKEYQIDALRKRIGIVLQDTHLFKGTVFENIHYGDFSANEKDVIEAAKAAGAHDFISKLPKRYETLVTEGGQNFSQGERQLISIARTLLNNPDLLILDEATSNIDTRTEAKIQASLETLMKNRTSIVIAHRLQTIQKADKILVIDHGKLIEQGTHESLLEQKGFYYELYHAQFAV